MRVKCRLVRIDLVQQHAVAIVFRLKNIELHASWFASNGSVRIRVYEAAKLRSRAFLEVKFDNNHEWHEPDLPLPAPLFAALRHFIELPAYRVMLPKMPNSSKYRLSFIVADRYQKWTSPGIVRREANGHHGEWR
jgi:hypothetical protein